MICNVFMLCFDIQIFLLTVSLLGTFKLSPLPPLELYCVMNILYKLSGAQNLSFWTIYSITFKKSCVLSETLLFFFLVSCCLYFCTDALICCYISVSLEEGTQQDTSLIGTHALLQGTFYLMLPCYVFHIILLSHLNIWWFIFCHLCPLLLICIFSPIFI